MFIQTVNWQRREEYKKLLLRPEWLEKRKKILKRDSYTCKRCPSKSNLHVHHKYYSYDKLPWQYPDEALETLCSFHHKKEHGTAPRVKNNGKKTKLEKRKKAKQKAYQKKLKKLVNHHVALYI